MRLPSVSDVLAVLLGPQPEPDPEIVIGPCDRIEDGGVCYDSRGRIEAEPDPEPEISL